MTRRHTNGKRANSVAASTLTQKDAERFEKFARKYTKAATSSKKKAKETLVSLGIYTKTGKLTKNYR